MNEITASKEPNNSINATDAIDTNSAQQHNALTLHNDASLFEQLLQTNMPRVAINNFSNIDNFAGLNKVHQLLTDKISQLLQQPGLSSTPLTSPSLSPTNIHASLELPNMGKVHIKIQGDNISLKADRQQSVLKLKQQQAKISESLIHTLGKAVTLEIDE